MASADTYLTATAAHAARGLRTPRARPCAEWRKTRATRSSSTEPRSSTYLSPASTRVRMRSTFPALSHCWRKTRSVSRPCRPHCVAAPPRLGAPAIHDMIGRGRLTRNSQLGGDRPLQRHLLSPPPQRGRPHTIKRPLQRHLSSDTG